MAYLGSKVVQALLPLIGWYLLGIDRPRLSRPSLRSMGLGVGSGLLLGFPVLIAYFVFLSESPLFADAPAQIASRLAAFDAHSPAGFITVALVLSCAHSLFEEYYWRWFAFDALTKRWKLNTALLVSSLAFASHHFIVIDSFVGREYLWKATIPFGLGVALGGAVWSIFLRRYGSLTPGWLSHALVDGAIMTVGYSILFGTTG